MAPSRFKLATQPFRNGSTTFSLCSVRASLYSVAASLDTPFVIACSAADLSDIKFLSVILDAGSVAPRSEAKSIFNAFISLSASSSVTIAGTGAGGTALGGAPGTGSGTLDPYIRKASAVYGAYCGLSCVDGSAANFLAAASTGAKLNGSADALNAASYAGVTTSLRALLSRSARALVSVSPTSICLGLATLAVS